MSANGKRRYESGAKKRAEKRRKEETATANTKSIDQDDETETSSLNEHEPEVFDLSRENPTDRGHFKEDIKNAALKKNIIQHGPCRPCGPFESVDINGSTTTNFSASYYNERHQNMSLPRHWLCYSMVLRMPSYMLPVSDPDGDMVRCQYAVNFTEGGGKAQQVHKDKMKAFIGMGVAFAVLVVVVAGLAFKVAHMKKSPMVVPEPEKENRYAGSQEDLPPEQHMGENHLYDDVVMQNIGVISKEQQAEIFKDNVLCS
eukprot:gene10800-19605_t